MMKKNMTINYRKRMVHKRDQIKKIKSYHKTKYFDLTAIIIFTILLTIFILCFIFSFKILDNMKNVLSNYYDFIDLKFL